MSAEDLAGIGERVMALSPDLVCLGGDLINTHPEETALLGPLLDVLDPPLGVYAVPGTTSTCTCGTSPRGPASSSSAACRCS